MCWWSPWGELATSVIGRRPKETGWPPPPRVGANIPKRWPGIELMTKAPLWIHLVAERMGFHFWLPESPGCLASCLRPKTMPKTNRPTSSRGPRLAILGARRQANPHCVKHRGCLDERGVQVFRKRHSRNEYRLGAAHKGSEATSVREDACGRYPPATRRRNSLANRDRPPRSDTDKKDNRPTCNIGSHLRSGLAADRLYASCRSVLSCRTNDSSGFLTCHIYHRARSGFVPKLNDHDAWASRSCNLRLGNTPVTGVLLPRAKSLCAI